MTPRTMMSIALGKLAMNFATRRRRSCSSISLGRPAEPITTTIAASSALFDSIQVAAPSRRPITTQAATNRWRLIESPACSILDCRLRRLRFAFSRSRRPSAICFLRVALGSRAETAIVLADARPTAARRFSARDSPPTTRKSASPPSPSAKHPAITIGLNMQIRAPFPQLSAPLRLRTRPKPPRDAFPRQKRAPAPRNVADRFR